MHFASKAAEMKMFLVVSLIYLAMVEGYQPRFSDEEKEVQTRGFKVYTTNGTANGAPCMFPFLYKGRIYNSCTKDDHSTYWCSTTYDYAKDYKWGDCLPVDLEPPKLLSCPKDFEISTTKSKERVSWSIPTYSDNCGTTCLIKITSNHRPFDFQKVATSIEVRYTAEDPSGNKNVECKFTVRIKDVQPPKLLSCPKIFKISTTKSKERVSWPTPTYSDNCGTTCFIGTISNYHPLEPRQAGTSIEVRYTAVDPSGNVNDACRFTVRIDDIGPPTLLSCPDDIVTFTSMRSSTVDWKTPRYSDNCGPRCPLKITSNFQPRFTRFLLGTTTTVHYEARDPSGNTNRDCVFTVSVHAYPCPRLAPPKYGMLTEFGDSLSFPSCERGFYPTQAFPSFYTCKRGNWQRFPPFRTFDFVPDCISTTPPPDMSLYFSYPYDGNCNSATAQAQVKRKILATGLCTGECSIDKLTSHCGETTV